MTQAADQTRSETPTDFRFEWFDVPGGELDECRQIAARPVSGNVALGETDIAFQDQPPDRSPAMDCEECLRPRSRALVSQPGARRQFDCQVTHVDARKEATNQRFEP